MTEETNQIHDAVRDFYSARAEEAPTSDFAADPLLTVVADACCQSDTADDCDCGSGNYDEALLEGLPVDVTGLSLGCGDPVTIAGLRAGETVLDLGSGGGIDCFLAARQVGPTGYVIGVDMTPAMLERANANKAKVQATNVEFRQGQIEALPVADDSIDVVISNCVINLSPDKPAVFRDIFRVLKPGGRISISDIVTEGVFSPEQQAQLDQWSACVTGAIPAERYQQMLVEAGFTNVQVVDKTAAPELSMPADTPRVFSARILATKPV